MFRNPTLWCGASVITLSLFACSGPAASGTTILPAQKLEILDASGQRLGTLELEFTNGNRSSGFDLYAGAPDDPTQRVATVRIGPRPSLLGNDPWLMLYEEGSLLGLSIHTRPVLELLRSRTSGGFVSANGKGDLSNRGSLAIAFAIAGRIARYAIYSAVGVSAKPPLDELMPSQDKRFVDKDQRPFLTTGLSPQGSPSFALFDDRGGLRSVVTMPVS